MVYLREREILIATPEASRKAKNVARNENVTVLVDVSGPPTRGVIVYGKAKLEFDYDQSWGIRLFEKYVEKGQAEKMHFGVIGLSKWVRIRAKPIRVASFDYAKDDKWRAIIE